MYKKKINILFVSHSSWLYGAEYSLLTTIKMLDKNKFKISLLIPDEAGPLFIHAKELGINVFVVNLPWWISKGTRLSVVEGFLIEVLGTIKILEILSREDIDIVYTNTIVKISAAIAAKQLGIPHIWHVREMLKEQEFETPISLEESFKMVDYFSDCIITNSKSTAEQFSVVIDKEKIQTIYNGIDADLFRSSPTDLDIRAELLLDQDIPMIATIGSVQRCKMQEMVIRAMHLVSQHYPKAALLIIGDGDPDYIAYLEELVGFYSIGDRVKFLGYRNDVPGIIQQIDLLVVPSIAEPFGRVTLEAMAAGKPIVATNAGGSPEIVVDGVIGYLVPPGDVDALASAITKILADPAMAEKMGVSGRERAITQFSVVKYVSSIEECIERVYEKSSIKEGQNRSAHNPDLLYQDIYSEITEIADSKMMLRSCSEIIALKSDKISELEARINHIEDLIRQRDEQIRQRDEQIRQRDEQIHWMKDSKSWRITAPLRRVENILRKYF